MVFALIYALATAPAVERTDGIYLTLRACEQAITQYRRADQDRFAMVGCRKRKF
jgi:hypothetical protein